MGDPQVTVRATITLEFAGLQIQGRTFVTTAPLSGLVNAQAADSALTLEIAKYITDTAAAIQNALATAGDSDAAVQQIATDMLADAATLTAGDPLNPPAGVTTPPLPGT